MLEREVPMRKSMKKFLAVVLTSLCVLGVPMVAFAGTAATQSVPACSCGGTGVYSGSVEVFGTVMEHDHPKGNGIVKCIMIVRGYDDTYKCSRCGAEIHTSHTAETHEYEKRLSDKTN